MRAHFTSGLHDKNSVTAICDSDGDVFLKVTNGHEGHEAEVHVTHEGAALLRDFLNKVLDGPKSRYEGAE